MNSNIPAHNYSRTLFYKPVALAILAGVVLAFFGPARAVKTTTTPVAQSAPVSEEAGQ